MLPGTDSDQPKLGPTADGLSKDMKKTKKLVGPKLYFAMAASSSADAVDTVKSFEVFKVPPRWLFLRIETTNGVVGWGEPNLEGYSDTVSD